MAMVISQFTQQKQKSPRDAFLYIFYRNIFPSSLPSFSYCIQYIFAACNISTLVLINKKREKIRKKKKL